MRKIIIPLLFCLSFCFSFSCKKEQNAKEEGKKEESASLSTSPSLLESKTKIFYFSHSTSKEKNAKNKSLIRPLSSIDKAPKCDLLPWVDSIRVSGMGFLEEKIFFIINKTGFMCFDDASLDNFSLFTEPMFATFSAKGFYNTDIGFLLHSYKTKTFEYISNDAYDDAKEGEELPILSRYNPISKKMEAILFPHHFNLPSYASLNSLYYNDKYYASFKLDNGKDYVDFKYFSFNNVSDILNKAYKEASQDVFRKKVAPYKKNEEGFSTLPKPLTQLINNIKEENLLIEYFDKNIRTPIKISIPSKKKDEKKDETHAIAFSHKIEGHVFCGILLNSGKLYIYDAQLNANAESDAGVVKTYLLPKLPKNFVYTYFAMNKNFLFVAWEEEEFFECGRSGIITIPLSKLKSSQ